MSAAPWRLVSLAVVLLGAGPAFAHAPDVQRAFPAPAQYFPLGIEHILTGFDHLLFLAALLLGGGRVRDVLYVVTTFTLAHSVTLALGVLGLVHPNTLAVEVLIALSIAYVAFENLLGRGRGKTRFAITLGFGLIHGLGFASSLEEVGVSAERVVPSLLYFNIGVESGQLLVLAGLLPAVRWLQRGGARRVATARGMSIALVAVGLTWAGERVLQGEVPVSPAAEATEPPRALGSVALARAAQPGQGVPRSVYPRARAAATPEVARLCHAFAALPRERRAQCSGKQPGALLTSECTRMLDSAVHDRAVAIEPAAAEQCIAEQHARYARCDALAQRTLAPPESCRALVRGQRAKGATCRSSLECSTGLHCKGASPVETGVCAEPSGEGARCGLSSDALGAYVPHRDADHPECAGACVRNLCTATSRNTQ